MDGNEIAVAAQSRSNDDGLSYLLRKNITSHLGRKFRQEGRTLDRLSDANDFV